MNFINSIAKNSNFAFFLRIFDEFFSGFRAKFQKIVTCVVFSIKFAKINQKFAENSVKIIHYYSKLFTGVLSLHHLQQLRVFFSFHFFGVYFSFGGCVDVRAQLATAQLVLLRLLTSVLPDE